MLNHKHNLMKIVWTGSVFAASHDGQIEREWLVKLSYKMLDIYESNLTNVYWLWMLNLIQISVDYLTMNRLCQCCQIVVL